MKFFIDPGHGGTETGAVGHGMIEKDINLVVSREVKRILELNGQEVLMSRTSDATVSLDTRCTQANNWGADYFISIHHNANDGNTSGSEVYHSVTGGKGTELAGKLSAEFSALNRRSRVIARASESNPGRDYYCVIRCTNMPAIISEFGYMDSQDYINFDTVPELLTEAQAISTACLKQAGITNIKYTNTVPGSHWAQSAFDYLQSKGIVLHETRFDDKITRGELFSLLSQILK